MKKHSKITNILSFVVIILLVVLTAVGCKKECKHEYAENVVKPTCTAEGYTDHTCTKCANTYRDANTAPTGHNYVEEVIAPTCSAEGYTKHTCSNCSDSYNDNFVPVTSHRFNGADCIYCSFKHPEEAITPDVEWYSQDKAVFNIETKEQLAGLASLVNEGTSFVNTVIYLNADIDLAYAPWTPIGNLNFAFDGTFVGNDHKICNLNVSSVDSYIGLFGNVSGELSDFTIDNASVFVSGANNYIGILCGYTTNKINGVKVDGYVDAKDSNNVGGILGYTANEISLCESRTDVVGYESVGGIIGSANENAAVFKSLVNYGNVSGSGKYVGGLFGSISASNSVLMEKIENYGAVIGIDKIGGLVGNIVAPNSVIYIDNAENYGDVTGAGEVGGLVGYVEGKVGSIIQSSKSSAKVSGEYYVGGTAGNAVNVVISDCSNEGSEISASSCVLVGDAYYAYVGGYVGSGYSVEKCVNNADIIYLARGSYVGGIAGYLTNGVTECTNNGAVSGYDYVGGIAGGVTTPNAINVINLNNTGAVSGNYRIGGIAGDWVFNNPIIFGDSTNSGAVNGSSFVGGIAGHFTHSNSALLTAHNLTNTGDVAAKENCVGGLFGYVNGKDSSTISNCTVKANISGLYIVGGLIGKTDLVHLTSSSNEGSTVTATGFIIEGEETNVYLGGYVGIGFKISDCTNNVDINYTSLGNYVGGIVGKISWHIFNCTNNASVTSTASKVGGIAGEAFNTAISSLDLVNDLVNTGAIKGSDSVGGIFGSFVHSIYHGSCEGYTITVAVSSLQNSGSVIGNNKVGGIAGNVYFNNAGDYRCKHTFSSHDTYSYSRLSANNLINSGNVSGSGQSGEVFGYFCSDGNSALDNYTVTGNITLGGSILEGTYDVGTNTNLALTNRVGPEVEEEIPET